MSTSEKLFLDFIFFCLNQVMVLTIFISKFNIFTFIEISVF